jgi:hypothetical protein
MNLPSTIDIKFSNVKSTWADVMGHHGPRFVTSEDDGEFIAILKNWRWWVANEAEVLQWLDDNEIYYELSGMVLTLYNKDEFALFLLRWA